MSGVKGNRPPVVDPGHQPVIFATGVAAVDRADDYVQITFCQDQMWGQLAVQECEVKGRVVITKRGFEELLEALGLTGAALLGAH